MIYVGIPDAKKLYSQYQTVITLNLEPLNILKRQCMQLQVSCQARKKEVNPVLTPKLVRCAHNWNNGMLESWNDGVKETSIQDAYYFIDFFVWMD